MSAHPRRRQSIRVKRDLQLHHDWGPGGLNPRAQRRAVARRGGWASGKARRPEGWAPSHPHRRDRQEALALAYPIRQVTRARFATLYTNVRPNGNTAGEETAWCHYRAVFACFRYEGQHYRTQIGQRAQALAKAGRPRCGRTVYRLNRLLEEMGLARIVRVPVRERNADGTWVHKDWLRVELSIPPRSKNVRPPPGAGTAEGGVPAFQAKTASAPPTSSAETENGARAGAEQPITTREGGDFVPSAALEARIRALEQSFSDLIATAGPAPGPDEGVSDDVLGGGAGRERPRGGVGLPQDAGRLHHPRRQAADRPGPRHADRDVGGDELGGGANGGP